MGRSRTENVGQSRTGRMWGGVGQGERGGRVGQGECGVE